MKSGSKMAAYNANWGKVMTALEDNLALVLLVLHEEYGFGKDRINKILLAMQDYAKMFDEWESDEVLQDKRKAMTAGFDGNMHEFLKIRTKGVIPDDIWEQFYESALPNSEDMRAEYKRNTQKAQINISVSEAAEIQAKVQAMRDYIKGI